MAVMRAIVKAIMFTVGVTGIYLLLLVMIIELIAGCGQLVHTEGGGRYWQSCVILPFKGGNQ